METDEPTAESPWALQLAARVEKLEPPTTTAVCAAAVLATIGLLADERSQPGGEWHDAVTTWNGERIRKLVRRGRASAWERATALAGVTAEVDGAEVRAFVPSRMGDVPRDLAKLQIRSTPLDEPLRTEALPPMPSGAMAIAITPEFEMSWGKQAAQCAHAGQRLWMTSPAANVERWVESGRPIVIVHPTAALWAQLHEASAVQIHDGGFTEIPAGTNTTVAWWSGDA